MKIIFMGTPEFAVPSFKALIENKYNVICIVTQKDRPRDRGQALKASPIKEYAISQNIPVLQPERISREPEIIEKLRNMSPDLFITCAFGQILPKSVLDIPTFGTINVHGSLLPKYRGAAPIQWAVIKGETQTGITTMFTDIGMDTGDILLKREIDISDSMTAGELHDKMSLLGAKTLIETIIELKNGSLPRLPQDDSLASSAPRLTKETGLINWTDCSRNIHNLIRGTTPWPGAYTFLSGSRMRIWRSIFPASIMNNDRDSTDKEGTIIEINQNGMLVKTGDGAIIISEIQVESNKRMATWQYCCGHDLKAGMILGGIDTE